jgi:hypothetical protein
VRYYPVRWWEWAALGLVIGLAALTKEGTLGLIPMAFGTATVAAWQRVNDELRRTRDGGISPTPLLPRSPASPRGRATSVVSPAVGGLLSAFILITAPALLVAGWWYYRNVVLYGDWLGWNAFIAVLGQRGHPASLAQLWGERRGFLMSFWGLFGGVNVPMWPWVYTALNVVLAMSFIGFLIYLGRTLIVALRNLRAASDPWFARLLRPVEFHFGLIVNLLFAAAIVYGLVQWATTTWSSQGRLVFTAISSLCVLMTLGLAEWGRAANDLMGRRTEIRTLRTGHWMIGFVAVFLFFIAAAAPWLWIRPAYEPPTTAGPLVGAIDATFGERMRLIGYEVEYDDTRPGDPVTVRLEWEALQDMDRDWSVFLHLNDPVLGGPIAQRDMYPGAGLLATSLLEPGRRWVDTYVLTIPATAIAPAELELAVGLYDFANGQRLPVTDDGPPITAADDAVVLATIPLAAAEGAYPNPVSIFFEHGLELVGFEVSPRRAAAGETIELFTYWRPAQPLPADYTFFAQIVGEDTTRQAAADVTPPRPTSGWAADETVEVRFSLPIDPVAPPDAYPLIVGLYTRTAPMSSADNGGFDRLQLVTPDGRLTDDFLILTLVRIDAPSVGAGFKPAPMKVEAP